MANKKFAEMSSDELQKQQKTIKLVTGILAGMLLALLVMVVLLSVKQGFNAVSMGLGVIPFALMPIVFLNLNSLKEIKKELNSRNNVV